MRPSSTSRSSHTPSYAEERDKQISSWLSEVEDVLAKIKGSSLTDFDKKSAMQQVDLLLSKYKLQIEEL